MKNSSSLIISLGIFLGLVGLGYFVNTAMLSVNAAQRTVVVKGLAEEKVIADNVVWPVVFRNNAESLNELYIAIDADNAKVKAFLLKNGIEESEISIIAPTIEDKNLYSSEGNKALYSYSAQSTITINSKKVKHIADLSQNIGELVKDGVALETQSARIVYSFNSLNELKPKMIEDATKNARDVAQKFAKDSESFLGKIKKANQGLFSISTPDYYKPELMSVRVVSTVEYYLVD